MSPRPTTVHEIVRALSELGGEAQAKQIKDQVTANRGGIPPQYSRRHSYRETIQKIIEDHCPESANFKGIVYFERIGWGRYRLIPKISHTSSPSDTVFKYGPKGESQQHLDLKLFIANHPELIGNRRDSRVTIERLYPTGDRVDILIENPDGLKSVIEIEIAGDENLIKGAKQLIKYRSLELAENGWQLDDKRCKAILVAYSLKGNKYRDFCKKYEIECLQVHPS